MNRVLFFAIIMMSLAATMLGCEGSGPKGSKEGPAPPATVKPAALSNPHPTTSCTPVQKVAWKADPGTPLGWRLPSDGSFPTAEPAPAPTSGYACGNCGGFYGSPWCGPCGSSTYLSFGYWNGGSYGGCGYYGSGYWGGGGNWNSCPTPAPPSCPTPSPPPCGH